MVQSSSFSSKGILKSSQAEGLFKFSMGPTSFCSSLSESGIGFKQLWQVLSLLPHSVYGNVHIDTLVSISLFFLWVYYSYERGKGPKTSYLPRYESCSVQSGFDLSRSNQHSMSFFMQQGMITLKGKQPWIYVSGVVRSFSVMLACRLIRSEPAVKLDKFKIQESSVVLLKLVSFFVSILTWKSKYLQLRILLVGCLYNFRAFICFLFRWVLALIY